VIDHFATEAVQKIQENPYRLLSFSAGWEEVDGLATRELGVDLNDGRRLAAAVEEVVYSRFTRGDTYVPRQLLITGLKRLLKVDRRSDEIIHAAIANSEITGRLLFDLSGNAYSIGASILEDRVVDAIRQRSNIISPACDVDGVIRAFEDRVAFDLEPEQRAAVHLAADHHFCVITGGAGCGKTTVLKAVCEVLEAQRYKVIQIALAGKAVKRMMEATDRQAFTIASFLKKLNDSADTGEIDASAPTAVLIDEASMVDLLSFAAIARALRDEVKIIMVGDPHQLPPVGPGLVLHALPGAPGIAHVELKAPRRFDSSMAAFANSIKDGVLQTPDDNSNIRWIEAQDEGLAELAASLLLESPDDAIVLTSTRELARMINQIVQESINKGKREIMVWNDEFECMEATGLREGDAVICTANHWDLGIQNGSMGTVLTVAADGEEGLLGEVEWDDGVVRPLTEDLLDDLELGWALTVHKSQGSQWRRVLVCLPTTSRMVDRSAIYTAVTRVRSQVLILGQRSHLVRAVAEKKAADRRHVGLPQRLARMYSNYPNPAKIAICDTNP
jgi:exodeoxyribonuclease V alpha subunit